MALNECIFRLLRTNGASFPCSDIHLDLQSTWTSLFDPWYCCQPSQVVDGDGDPCDYSLSLETALTNFFDLRIRDLDLILT